MTDAEANDFPVLRDLHNPNTQGDLVDLVFVHGLGGHFRETWTTKNASRPWIEDSKFLGELEHKVRVLSFGYNANRFGNVANTRIIHHANSLLRALVRKRHDCPERPIIFIAHSLGGLVVKKAILLSPTNLDWGPIKSATKAVLFMGTPHMGSEYAGDLSLVQNLVSWAKHEPAVARNLTQELETFSNTVQDINQEFSLDVHRPINMLCFYESRPQRLPNGKSAIIVPQWSAILQGVGSQDVSCTHSELPKFKSPAEARFETFWEEVCLCVQKATSEKRLEQKFADLETPTLNAQEMSGGKHVQSRLWLVPIERNKNFVGRDAILQQLVRKADPYADTEHTQRIAIDGLGGIGKTQIALEAACRIRDKHPDCSVFWVPAVDATSFENAYREIGCELKVKGIDEDKADVKRLVKAALSRRDSSTWLLVVDNADDAKLLLDRTTSSLAQYLPSNKHGSILFTTRNHEVAVDLVDTPAEDIIPVGEMSNAEARELLTRGLKDEQLCDASSTASLLDLLANLPLAIKQAMAYMAKTEITITRYLDNYRSSNETMVKLLSRDFEDRTRYRNIKNPVATTWLISFEYISRDNQLAAQYLRFLCFLAEKDIPTSLLPLANDKLQADEAIGALKAYAFIMQREEQDSFDIHRLVRLAMRNWLDSKGEQAEYRAKAIQRVAEVFPSPEYENRKVWTKYLPHAQSVLQRRVMVDNGKAQRDLAFFSMKHGDSKVWKKYFPYAQPVLQFRRGMVDNGKAERDLLSYVGGSLYIQGKYAEAEAIHQQALELREKALKRNHPDVLMSINNLGAALEKGGKYAEAEVMHRQALKLRDKTLGRDHPDTLGSMNNLGNTLDAQGKYDEAEAIHHQALELMEKLLSRDHPDTLMSINNLGNTLDNQGRYAEAEGMHRKALNLMKKALGHDHQDTLRSMNNLGIALYSQGKYIEAEEMHQQAVGLRKKVLGLNHSDTLRSMNNLGLTLDRQGKYAEAEVMHRCVFELMEKVLGCDHPDTLRSMNNLRKTLNRQGKYLEAEQVRKKR